MADKVLEFYSRQDIQQEILALAKNREIAVRFGDGGFGKRPDIIQFKEDIIELIKQGATSFHFSEERWKNPLDLRTGLSKKELDDLRLGWDLVLDIDTPYWDYAKLTAKLLVDALMFHDIRSISCKYTGGKGFHICLPFEAFPHEVNGVKTKDLYPEGLRVIAAYLTQMIREPLAAEILAKEDFNAVIKKTGKRREELIDDKGRFNPFSIIDIDTVLISSRHLFRSVYSFHEKTGLVSIPINPEQVLSFEKEAARPEKVNTSIKFLDASGVLPDEARTLIIQAFDWDARNKKKSFMPQEATEKKESYELPKIAIKDEDFFPECIKKILRGGLEDGKKRSLFILINFLKNLGWSGDEIKAKVLEWNKKNAEQLRENYVLAQLSWHNRQKQSILPPNCSNTNYYRDLRLCDGLAFCSKFKNPVNFALKRARTKTKAEKKKQ